MNGKLTRRQLLRVLGVGAVGTCLAACAPKVVEVTKIVKEVVKETVIVAGTPKVVEKEVTKVVKEVVKETVIVEKPAEKGPVKLTVMWQTSPREQPMVDQINAAFVAKRPDIFMEQVVAPWAEYEPKLMSMYAAGIAPDIFGLGGTNVYVERFLRGVTLSLDPHAERDKEFMDSLWPLAIKSYTIGGHLCALAMYLLPAGVFINSTRFDEAGVDYPPVSWHDEGWTWDDMIETAKKLTRDTTGDGKTDVYGLQPGHWNPWYYTRLWGEDVISEEDYAAGIVHKLQTDDPNVYDACVTGLQARADAVYKHEVTPTPATMSAMWQLGSPLKTGAIAMEFTGGWTIDGGLPEEFEFRCAPNPLGCEGGTRGKMAWASALTINSQTPFPDEAWEWCKFFCSDEEMVLMRAPLCGQTPSDRSLFEKYLQNQGLRLAMTDKERDAFFRGAAETAERSCPCQILAGWAAARDTFRAELDPVWLGEKTAKEAVDAFIPKVNAILEENVKQLGLS